MRLSQRTVLGLRVTTTLARRTADGPARLKLAELADIEGASPALINDVLQHLRIAGLVRSRRGVLGGWMLNRPPCKISVAEVVTALDGPPISMEAASDVTIGGTSSTDRLWHVVQQTVRDVLGAVSIADLARDDLPATPTGDHRRQRAAAG
jgi:Rrf2 family protein